MRHKEKVKLAIKLSQYVDKLTGRVRSPKKSWNKKFMTEEWEKRKKAIAERHRRNQEEAHQEALKRKEIK